MCRRCLLPPTIWPAGHASHTVNDFRKIAGIEAYTPTDNVSELTALINDDGWDSRSAAVTWSET